MKIALIFIFSIAMAYFEAAVVVYLRALFYPEGFSFPLKVISPEIIVIELFRELSTMIMIAVVAYISGRRPGERFGYFLIIFGVWDIFYYVWLKLTLDWPSSLSEWDILFLIPLPWIGPVIAPVMIALLMVGGGLGVTRRYAKGLAFRPVTMSWIFWIIATVLILYSFMHDIQAGIRLQMPRPYLYSLLIIGLILYFVGYMIPYGKAKHFGDDKNRRR